MTLVRVATEVRSGVETGQLLWLWCPGCEAPHCPRVRLPGGYQPDQQHPYWDWNGCADERLTISPSLLVYGVKRCHSFIRQGKWEFLGDCEHDLAGKTVPLVPLPDWLDK